MGVSMRLWEIDALRGIAIIMMIMYHTVFDLGFLGIIPFSALYGFWRVFAFITASLFLVIVGVSLTISRARAAPILSGMPLELKYVKRGAGIFGLGLLVTLATWLYLGEGFVVFGILHLIGVSVILAPLLFRLGRFTLPVGIVCIIAGALTAGTTGPAMLLPLGVMPPGFHSVDFIPLLPFLGVVLIGMYLGWALYPGGNRQAELKEPPAIISRPLQFLGRHSLPIYLVHQPVMIILIHFITGVAVL